MTATTQPTSKRRRSAAPKSKPRPWPEFVGSWPRLEGRQEPAFESRHPGDESEGDRCAQFGHNLATKYRTKTRCMPWQWSTVRGVLSLRPANAYGERVWTHRDVCIECTRQQGKTLIVVLLILFHLFVAPVFGRSRPLKIVYTAQRWSTAKDVFDRTVRVIFAVPWLRQRLAKNPSCRDNHGIIEVALKRDRGGKPIVTAVCEFAPRSQEFGRGITELDILFLDEAYDIDPGIENDLTGAQSASDNPQTIYLSTPPVFAKHPKSHTLADMHRLGHARAPHLFYRLFKAPESMSRDDPAAWVIAQPSYGVATNELEIFSKRQKARSAIKRAIFDADYLGWGDYPPAEVEGESEIPTQTWGAMKAKTALSFVGPKVLVLERASSGSPWVIIGAQRTTAGLAHIEVRVLPVSEKVVLRRLVAAVEAWDPAAVVVRNRSSAGELIPRLETAGIDPTVVNSTEVAQACGLFLSGALTGEFSHADQPELNDGVSLAEKHQLPAGGFVWEEVEGAAFPCLVGASLSVWALVKFGAPAEPVPAPEFDSVDGSGFDSDPWTSLDSDFDVLNSPL